MPSRRRRGLRIAVWIVVFAACAGVGAFIASRTDPFPPGVEDPGARPTTSNSPQTGTTSPEPEGERWAALIDSRTWHDLPVGGRCVSLWRSELELLVDANGAITGDGAATLKSDLTCDFDVSQLQAEELRLVATGRVRGDELVFTVSEQGRTPPGSKDYGGLTNTLNFLKFRVPAVDGEAITVSVARPADAGRGEYGSVNHLRLTGPTTA